MYFPRTVQTMMYQERGRLNHAPASALAAGDIVPAGGSVFGYAQEIVAAGKTGVLDLPPNGLRRVKTADATAFAVGDEVWWDASAGLAVAPGLALDGSADYPLGICVEAKAANVGNTVAIAGFDILDRYGVIRPLVYEFDCDGTNGDTDEHVLAPAWMNRHGLLFRGAFALVTEVFAGSTQDQGIVTVEDEDDNALSTITPADAGADAVGDILYGTNGIFGPSPLAAGAPAKVIAAGKAVQGFVSQPTTGGTPAGKMKVYLDLVPLV